MTQESSQVESCSGSFLGAKNWHSEYQRNNKGGGLKNLRCFPYCRDKHVVKGFCGLPVKFELKRKNLKGKLCAWGEFVTERSEGRVAIGAQLSETDLEANERSTKCLSKPIYKGVTSELVSGGEDVLFEFNRQKQGWNYSWHSNKHTSGVKHVFIVYIFETSEDGKERVCVGKFKSPSFKLFSRRKGDQDKKSTLKHNHLCGMSCGMGSPCMVLPPMSAPLSPYSLSLPLMQGMSYQNTQQRKRSREQAFGWNDVAAKPMKALNTGLSPQLDSMISLQGIANYVNNINSLVQPQQLPNVTSNFLSPNMMLPSPQVVNTMGPYDYQHRI
mmetsp:Transcript_16946/g.19253  ORF Transcript_16946/g.19253 Transcript_16946/m.19253 type:complete len:328 (+) Transcript_16946:195-1178(+)